MSPLVKIALGGAVLGGLLWATSSHAGENKVLPKTEPDNKGGGGGGRKTIPNYPPGSGDATVYPNPQNGMLIRTTPDSQPGEGPGGGNGKTNLAAPEGDLHLRPGDHAAVIKTGIKGQDNQAGEWWYVIAPSGVKGYTRAVPPPGSENKNSPNGWNLNLLREPTAESAASIAGAMPALPPYAPQQFAAPSRSPAALRNFGMDYNTVGAGQSRFARRREPQARIGAGTLCECAAPAGTFLRPAPDAPGNLLIPPGAKVLVDEHQPGNKREPTSPGLGGWTRVRYLGPGMRAPATGFALSEWLRPVGGPGAPDVMGRSSVSPWAHRSY